MPMSRTGTWKNRSAFTLIELVVVLFIVALFAALVIPRLGAFLSHGDTNKAIRQIRGLARYLTGMSASTRTPYRLHYDLDEERCWVSRSGVAGEFIEEQETLVRPLRLPNGVRFQEISTPRGVSKEGVYTVVFYATDDGVPNLIAQLDVVITVGDVPTPSELATSWWRRSWSLTCRSMSRTPTWQTSRS
jgi:prepilin-type N-terminal cleavage/methylation domain-containing protein